MKYNHYSLERLSEEARKLLPGILDSNGYAGRYVIYPERESIAINSTFSKLAGFFHRAEAEAKGEEGRLVFIRQESFSTLWISGDKSLKEAYREALDAVDNGWPVDNDPVTAVCCAEDSDDYKTYREEWQLEYMPDKKVREQE